jgi:peptide/nickel transport system ATP-binding protein
MNIDARQEFIDPPSNDIVLNVQNLCVNYETDSGDVVAANHINFKVFKGEILGLVGESGCGKTTTAMAILQLVQPPGRIIRGEAVLNGIDLLKLNERELRKIRWKEIALIPQGAMNSLNPVYKVKDQISETILAHEGRISTSDLEKRIFSLFDMVDLPERVYDMYPHELSGGMKQRVCIAMAIALYPRLIVADEPTSALDVIVQRVVAQSLINVKKKMGVSMILIGHDMGLQAQLVDRIAVMYAGNIVEVAPTGSIFQNPMHPYTQLLIASIPSIKKKKPLLITEGLTHDLRNSPPGCIFQFRCPYVKDICRVAPPPHEFVHPRHSVACYLYSKEN